ncbi:hypothetical protein PIB30_013234 [Stylosanthes scabra]|uniref:Ubiquitin-like protease family profile domain-containing protein n=1 Tax=Stylosanthes scabra TaxID=79078 RepID=A0ABU6R595_9FABA|nr:hypothetical protein [Stylosanthes scabra]
MFEKYEHKWLDDKKKPQDFRTLLNHKEFLSYLDKDKLQSHRFSNILDQLLRWAGRPSMFRRWQNSLLPMYINIPQQPNEYDCAVFVMKWMEELDPTILKECHDGTREHNIQPRTAAELENLGKKLFRIYF